MDTVPIYNKDRGKVVYFPSVFLHPFPLFFIKKLVIDGITLPCISVFILRSSIAMRQHNVQNNTSYHRLRNL